MSDFDTVDSPLQNSFEATVSDRDDLEELWKDVDAFAGTLAEQFEGDIRVSIDVAPILELDDNE